MKNINRTINLLKRLIRDENCRHMNLSTIKGYLGELIVKAKLESEGCTVEQKGNQCGYDLEVDNIKIDVKTSTLKEETIGEWGWGFALKQKSKKRKLSCTHFVCLALDKKITEKAFYVIKKEDIGRFPAGPRRFGNVENRFWVYLNENKKDKNVLKVGVNENLRKFLNQSVS